MELIVAVFGLVVVFCVSLWIIHKQTIHARDMQTLFLQRNQFNFETQWQLWVKDRATTDQTINNLAAWNTKLCESHAKMGEQLQSLLQGVETRLAFTLSQQLAEGVKTLAETVGKSKTNT